MHLRAVEVNRDGTNRTTSRTVEPTVVVIALVSRLPIVTLIVIGPVAAVVAIAFAITARHELERVARRRVARRGAAKERAKKNNQTESEFGHADEVSVRADLLQEDRR